MSEILESRPLSPCERYFALMHRIVPVHTTLMARTTRVFPVEDVRRAWSAVSATHPALRSRIVDGELQLLAGSEAEVRVYDTLHAALADNEADPVDPERAPLLRLLYIPGEASAVWIVTGHHAVEDGSGALSLLKQIFRELDVPGSVRVVDTALPPAADAGLPPELRWRERGPEFRARLRELAEKRRAAPPVGAVPDHQRRTGERSVDGGIWWLDEDQSAEVLAITKAAGATMTGLAGALWAEAIADHVVPSEGSDPADTRIPTLGISIPIDTRNRVEPKVAYQRVGTYISMLNATVPVTGGTLADRARDVTDQMRAGIRNGEPELFYAVLGTDALPFSEKGDARMQALQDGAPQAFAVSNLGVIDDTGDPEWVDRMFGTFIPMQNQVAYIVPSTYRGKTTLMVNADTYRLTPELAKKLLTWPLPLASGEPEYEPVTGSTTPTAGRTNRPS
ncbi:phthiocerol/phthiodiolone dimycocerosyl transferase family protein [Marmoricola sp. RAF53]|uniref:phthiocerol/phthiodiolone dimycocerosyl transferase family protein n=1 Tax=Marmoricola sp. RAF53 TaxID=3233059 RepID=UPI003F9DE76B